MHVVGFLLMT